MVQTTTRTIRLYRAQIDFVRSRARYSAFIGGIGSGKTTAGCVKLLYEISRGARLCLVVAPTYPMLRDVVVRKWHDVCDDLITEFNRSEMRCTLVNGAEILFRSADEPDHLRGPNVYACYVDEAAQISYEAWLVLLGRVREGPERAWVTSTPKGHNWLWEFFIRDRRDDCAVFHATTYDNPYLSRTFIESVASRYVGAFARQELGGEFVAPDGALFRREWFRVVERAPDGLRWVRYWDLATSTNESADYTASARCALADDGTLYIADMVRGRWEWPDVRKIIIQTARAEPFVLVGIERAGFQLAAVQELMREPQMVNVAVYDVAVDRDKLARALPWAARAEAGRVALVRGEWIADFLSEVCNFPNGEHDDQIDAVSGAVQMMTTLISSEQAVVLRYR